MTLGIKFTQVTPLYPHRVFLQWDLINPSESGSYTFTIERSGSSEGPWELLKAGAQNTYNYIDDMRDQPGVEGGKPNLFSLQRQFYYRVTAVPPSGCVNSARTEPHALHRTDIDPTQMGLRRRLRYDDAILWRRFNGVRLAVLKRRRWGPYCTTCYDPVTRAVTSDHCLECYGTGFVEGYWAPVVTYGRVYPPDNVEVQLTDQGRRESLLHKVTILDVPLLQDGDLIVELAQNRRHLVRLKSQTELQRKPVHQQVSTSLIEHDAIEYHIPVDLRATPPLM